MEIGVGKVGLKSTWEVPSLPLLNRQRGGEEPKVGVGSASELGYVEQRAPRCERSPILVRRVSSRLWAESRQECPGGQSERVQFDATTGS